MMKTEFIIEEIVFAIMWTVLYMKIFPKSDLNKTIFPIVHATVISICSCGIGFIAGRRFLPLLSIWVSGCLNWISTKHIDGKSITEAIFSYLIARVLKEISAILNFFFLIFVNPLDHDFLAGICVSVVHIFLCLMCAKYVSSEFWKVATGKYYMRIVTALGMLFVITYGVFIDGGEQQKGFYIYALGVSVLAGVILFMWAKGTSEQKKIEESQSKHIEELVRRAHKYKSVIPSVERELRMEQRRLLREHRWEAAAEVDYAIDEVVSLGRDMSADSMKEMAEGPAFSSTGLRLLDSQIQGERETAVEQGVVLDCIVTAPASTLVRRGVLRQFRLQQMVGDLLQNALRAVREQENEERRVLLIMGDTPEGYQIKICDTGRPFPVEILWEFGKRGLTTGGTGHGLADLCEIMAECGGSIEVVEYEEGSSFTKAISLTMDGRATLAVHSAPAGIDYERSLAPEPVSGDKP